MEKKSWEWGKVSWEVEGGGTGGAHEIFVRDSDFSRHSLSVDSEIAQRGVSFGVGWEPVGEGQAAGREAAEVVAAFRL